MKYGTRTGNAAKARTQCTIVGVYENNQLTPSARQLDKESKGYLKKILKRGDIKGKSNQVQILNDVPNLNAARVMLVGLGNPETMDSARYAGIVKTVIARLQGLNAKHTLCCLLEIEVENRDSSWKTIRLVEQFAAGLYKFTEMKGKPKDNGAHLDSLDLYVEDKSEVAQVTSAIDRANALTAGINQAKDLLLG